MQATKFNHDQHGRQDQTGSARSTEIKCDRHEQQKLSTTSTIDKNDRNRQDLLSSNATDTVDKS